MTVTITTPPTTPPIMRPRLFEFYKHEEPLADQPSSHFSQEVAEEHSRQCYIIAHT